VILACAVLIQYSSVTDGQTPRRSWMAKTRGALHAVARKNVPLRSGFALQSRKWQLIRTSHSLSRGLWNELMMPQRIMWTIRPLALSLLFFRKRGVNSYLLKWMSVSCLHFVVRTLLLTSGPAKERGLSWPEHNRLSACTWVASKWYEDRDSNRNLRVTRLILYF